MVATVHSTIGNRSMKPLTLIEIARLAGVSRTTASYVINGKAKTHRISEATVEKVMAVVDAHGYRIDIQAAALRRGVTRTLGFVVPDLANASYARLAKQLELGARRAGYQLLIGGTNDEPDTERELALSLRARRCDALITASCLSEDDGFYAELMAEGMPVIGVDRPLDPERFACVVGDDCEGARTLTLRTVDDSVGKVVWLDAVAQISISRARRRGFDTAMESLDASVVRISATHYDCASGSAAITELLERDGLPDALITASYTLLEGALEALTTRYGSLFDPRLSALRLATFGDDRLLDFLPQRVESLRQRYDQIAALTLEHALGALDGHYRPGHWVVPRSHRSHHRS